MAEKKPVDWTKYGPCDTCLQGPGQGCIHLHTNEPIEQPHSGREKVKRLR